ncbi:MAG TPA: inositol monophosphatase [Planctomycetes bacterium]|nr:inositol monophosphatase [Planctomycetota bacterium]HIN80157.1 inositol monophosphatase [Planctomycetota bacterium]
MFPSESGLDGVLDSVVELARRAGEKLVALGSGDLEVAFKGPRDLVTAADRASEDLILDWISSAFPDDRVLSEERGGDSNDLSGRLWIVDPLDGTTNYTHGHPMYAVSIALFEDGVPLLAAVHAPVLTRTWWASRGGGAFCDGVPISISGNGKLSEALLATGFSYRRRELEAGALEIFGRLLRESRDIRRGGSASIDLADTARGVFDGFWEFHLSPHDVAAGALLITEAGGVVTDVTGGDDWLTGGSIVAGGPAMHRILSEVLLGGVPHPGREGGGGAG